MSQLEDSPLSEVTDDDVTFKRQIQRLHKLTVYGRWAVVCLLWLALGPLSVWNLRSEVALWRDYFTWTALKFGLAYHPIATFSLALCIGITVAVLLWQSRIILFGLSAHQTKRLERMLFWIRQQGSHHPLWRWVCKE
jgi:uncharacterized Tic20 family protein